MKPFVLACASARPEWARRLRAIAEARGWRLLAAPGHERLLSLLEPGCRGLIVADWEALDGAAGAARRWVARARLETCGFSLIFAAGPGCFGSSLSRVLAAGADDVVDRTLPEKELAKRLLVQAERCLRRHGAFLEAPGVGLRVDRVQSKVFLKERGRWKAAGPLSPKELSLLCCFLENPGAVLARSSLLDLLRPGRAHDVNAETVDKHVQALRRKLGRSGRLITAVYGAGYKLEPSAV